MNLSKELSQRSLMNGGKLVYDFFESDDNNNEINRTRWCNTEAVKRGLNPEMGDVKAAFHGIVS